MPMNEFEKRKCEALLEKYSNKSMNHNLVDVNVVRQLDEESIDAIRKFVMVKLQDKLDGRKPGGK